MSFGFRVLLILALAFLDAPGPLGAETALHARQGAGCDVTIRGHHGGQTGTISWDLARSLRRSSIGLLMGNWKSFRDQRTGGDLVERVLPSEHFSRVVRLDFGCDTGRQYRFFFRAEVASQEFEYTHYYPNDIQRTSELVIDLGDVSRFFEAIEPGPPVTPPTSIEPTERSSVSTQALESREIPRQRTNSAIERMRESSSDRFRVTVDPRRERPNSLAHADVEIAEACAEHLQLNPSVATIVDPIVAEVMAEQEIVGMSVGVIQGGVITYLKGHGYADRESGSPVGWRTIFRWASISKPLTAVAALSLWEDGDVLLHEDIRTYVPEYPAKPEGPITLHMLLSNTSGVRHYDSLRTVNYPYGSKAASFPRELPINVVDAVGIFDDASLIAPMTSPPFTPGSAYHYSSFGFNLAGAVVERAAKDAFGLSFTEFIQERIADPLCMESLAPDEPGRQSNFETRRYIKSRNNVVYRVGSDDREDDSNVLWKIPSGGYQSNIRDLALFARALMERELLDEPTHAFQETVVMRNYGLGMRHYTNDHDSDPNTADIRRIGHGGIAEGVRAAMYFDPDRDLGIVLLINSGHAARRPIFSRLANALGTPWTPRAYVLSSTLNCSEDVQTRSRHRFAGIWQDGPSDQLLRRGYTTGLFARERESLRDLGYHLTEIETYGQDGTRLWDGVFTRGVPRTKLWRDASTEDFVTTIAEQRAQGFELDDVEVYSRRPGDPRWSGVFAPASEARTLIQNRTVVEFQRAYDRLTATNHRLVDVEKYEGPNGERWFAGLFVRGTGGHALDLDVAPENVDARMNQFARNDLRVIDLERYTSGSSPPRWALVAGPTETDRTSRIDKTFCGTWDGPYTGFLETHEDLMFQGRSLVDYERYPALPTND